jgi:tetratricopeptide (TPR) repeat protein
MDECIREVERARELDPLSPVINSDFALYLHFAARHDEAIAQCNRILELDPDFFPTHLYLGMTYCHTGEYKKALNQYTRVCNLMDRSDLVEAIEKGYTAAGFRGAVKALA